MSYTGPIVSVGDGGTGANTAAGARTNLGITDIATQSVTQYDLLVGGAANAITSVGPGSAGQVVQSGGAGANPAYSTATYPSTATGTGTILRADGTNWSATTLTMPTTLAVDNIFYSSSTNILGPTPLTAFARTLIDDTTAAAAATTLGLGTSSNVSFATINSSISAAGTAIQATTSEPGATAGPLFESFRNSGSPANADIIGGMTFTGRSSTAVKREYSAFETTIVSASNTAESASLAFYTMNAGARTKQIDMLNTGCQVRGNNTNTAPPAGYLGEEIRSQVAVGAGTTLTSGAGNNFTSISLTAGVWDISSVLMLNGTVTGTIVQHGITTSSTGAGAVVGDNRVDGTWFPTAVTDVYYSIPSYRVTLSGTTTYYANVAAAFTVGTCVAYGRISAVRVG